MELPIKSQKHHYGARWYSKNDNFTDFSSSNQCNGLLAAQLISINLMSKHKLPISGIVQLGTEGTSGSAFFLYNIMMAFDIKFEMHCTKKCTWFETMKHFQPPQVLLFLSSAEMNTVLEKSKVSLCTWLKGVNKRTKRWRDVGEDSQCTRHVG